ncbi:MAG: amino acid-binding protein [bacterium]|nr:amino acid-binding protein [bacterium]
MVIKQLSVFIENREGRLEKVTETLAKNEINIVSLSLADTAEYGVLRLIVSDPIKGKQVLKDAEFSAMLTDVIAIKLPHNIGKLQKVLTDIVAADLSVEYMYTLATGENASLIVKTSDTEKAVDTLIHCGYELFPAEDAYKINCED